MANTLNLGTNGNWATKKDSLLAYNSENGNFKPLPFDFDRASSATVINKEGLIETVGSGEPRIDYKDDSKGALLLEPSRSNSLLQSNQFDTTWASSTGIGISSGYGGVYGSNDAWLLKRADGNSRYLYQNVSLSNTQTFSIYLKADTTNWAWLFLGGTTSWAYFDLENGAVGATNSLLSSKIEPVSDGWFRCSITANVTLSSVRVYPAQSNLAVSGDSNLGIYIQNAQLEQGSYATSYIPTQGSAVTRTDDACSQTPPSGVIGQTEGSIYSEFKCLDSITNIILWMRDGSGGNYTDMIKLEVSSSNVFRLEIRESNGNSVNITSSALTVGNYYKVAVGYKQNDYVVYINGVQIGTDTSGNVPTCSEMYIGKYIDGGIRMGVSKDLKLYNTRLSNAELQALTTL